LVKSLHIDTAETWRGGQNQVLLTVTGLAELGHQAVLVAHANGELKRRASEGLRFIGFSPRSEFDVQAGWQLARVLSDLQPDVIHAHDPMAVALTAVALQMKPRLARAPLVVASRRVDFHLKRHAFSKWKYRHVNVFIAASSLIAQVLQQDGITADRVEVVHDGVNIAFIDKQPRVDAHAELWLPSGAPLIGNVAALAPHKGQRYLVSAAAIVVREIPDARFLIVGEGELREAIERQIRELGLDRHVFATGFRHDALGLMKSFDIFAMSSLTEGLGSAVLEAMACERPTVATRAGGIPEIVRDGETGFLVPPHDERAMAEAILGLLRDPGLRSRFATAGRARVVAEFSVEKLVAGTAAVYEKWLSGPDRAEEHIDRGRA
jgi:glycosyltransferase involved in cell wall biosynthesis